MIDGDSAYTLAPNAASTAVARLRWLGFRKRNNIISTYVAGLELEEILFASLPRH
jgi:hypothetical protein